MLSQGDLVSISRALQDERVLTIYVNGAERHPAVRDAWRVSLDAALKTLRQRMSGAPREERAAFDAALAHVDARLSTFNGAIGAPGLVLFATAHAVVYEEALPVEMPTVASWELGPSLVHYARALKERHTIVLLLLANRKASLFHYRDGSLSHDGTVTVHATAGRPELDGDATTRQQRTGARRAIGRDALQRAARAGTSRLLHDAVDRALQLAGNDGWILVAGLQSARARATPMLAARAPHRVLQLDSIDLHATIAVLAEGARRGASRLRDERDLEAVVSLIAEDGAGAMGADSVIGTKATRAALERGAVRRLFFTPAYVAGHVQEAEAAVRLAFSQGAEVEEVSRGVAVRLDEVGGIAARLRFVQPKEGVPT